MIKVTAFPYFYSERFTTVPKPLTDSTSAFGVHSVICCPDQNIDPAALQEEEEYNYDSEYDAGDFYDYGGAPTYDFLEPSPPPTVQFLISQQQIMKFVN